MTGEEYERRERMITAKQCRAARAMLGWSRKTLAVKTNLSDRTVMDFEHEVRVPHKNNLKAVQETLERAGIEFSANGGVCAVERSGKK